MNKVNYFFIHIPKNMGTCIQQNLPLNQSQYWGEIPNIESYYNSRLADARRRPAFSQQACYRVPMSIDHLTCSELFQLGILNVREPRHFFMIMREPVSRFLSLCNYWNISPDQLIVNIRERNVRKTQNYMLFQHIRPQADYIDDCLQVVERFPEHRCSIFFMGSPRFSDFLDFCKIHFGVFGNFDEPTLVSEKKTTVMSLTTEHFNFIREYYARDFELFDTN
jgi:hypothetical protein